ncbi:MAG: hypothetical protein F2793_00735 [Actinobacteria bacterium]|uniref:Unannotated protein n=1 Tax=freshwater metagenome TaxID=449393 RepID=A0A6J7CXV8_9ZZZZ|nr:hypothetical protein [Actinomycetota bacterium]
MNSRTRTIAIAGAVALASSLLMAGCGGSSTSTESSAAPTAATWSPPRPTGAPDDFWANYATDPKALSADDFAKACAAMPIAKESGANLEALLGAAPGSTQAEWDALTDYINTYVQPLCP